MSAKETKTQIVTMIPKGGGKGVSFEAEVLLHLHDVVGSQIIVLRTLIRESVEKFLHKELVDEEK